VNNMFAQVQTVGWLEAVESIADVKSTWTTPVTLCDCNLQHKWISEQYICMTGANCGRVGGGRKHCECYVIKNLNLPSQAHWSGAGRGCALCGTDSENALRCSCIHHNCWVGVLVWGFKAVEPPTVQDLLQQRPAFAQLPLHAGQPNTIYIVKPELQWFTCGIWQDVLYLCWHGWAVVFRKSKEKDLSYVLQNLVHPYYKFECIQQIYKNNIFPACIDSVKYNDTTRPPVVKKPQPGRPRSKQLCQRSEFLDRDKSPITCSDCGQQGHNKRTFKNQGRM
jgi:hypothetical protein